MTLTAMDAPAVALPSRRQVAKGAAIAATVGAIAVVFFILPAEVGIDPTGFGERSGLTGLSQDAKGMNVYLQRGLKRTGVLYPLAAASTPDEATLRRTLAGKNVALPSTIRSDRWTYELLPYENIEMKYRLTKGQAMVFRWQATKPVQFDQHSVPDQGGNPATESFVITNAATQAAVYVAPFTGIHGWFWQNTNLEPVTVTIEAAGGFTGAVIFNEAGEHPRDLQPG